MHNGYAAIQSQSAGQNAQ
ncbi:hypothetical protein JWZ98_19370 [Methylomonas sp. EFPC1]|nr:hypothetical protein JWZ98_19370 [Methylomonas sp. EFPC1]